MPPALTRWRPAIEAEMRLAAPDPGTTVGRMVGHHLGWTDPDGRPASGGGKLFRGHLVMWSGGALGAPADELLPVAAAVEWIHSFTLVHDDIQDGDTLRRGRPTVNAVWGDAQAINAGDAMHALAVRGLLAEGPGLSRRTAAARALLDGLLRVIDGQSLDLQLEGQVETSVEAYIEVCSAKTGALIGASLEAGARVAGSPDAVARRFARAGRLLGLAFQLRDDWLGVWGDPIATGKSRDGDLARRKPTYETVTAYDQAGPVQREALRRLFASTGSRSAGQLRALLEDLAGPGRTQGAAVAMASQAVDELAGCGLDRSTLQEFADVADFAARRER